MAAERRRQLRLSAIERTRATEEQAKGLSSDLRGLYGINTSMLGGAGTLAPPGKGKGGGKLRPSLNLFNAGSNK